MGPCKDPVISSTRQDAMKQDEGKRLVEAPDKGEPLPSMGMDGIVPTTLCMATDQSDKGQPPFIPRPCQEA